MFRRKPQNNVLMKTNGPENGRSEPEKSALLDICYGFGWNIGSYKEKEEE